VKNSHEKCERPVQDHSLMTEDLGDDDVVHADTGLDSECTRRDNCIQYPTDQPLCSTQI